MLVGGILAGGTGSRMKSASLPKQFLPLGGEPIVMITLRRLLQSRFLDVIYIVIHPQWEEYMRTLLKSFVQSDGRDRPPIYLVRGGRTRLESIENLLNQVSRDYQVSEEDGILIHDSVRPFVSEEILARSADKLKVCQAVGVACPVHDTMFQIREGDLVEDMPRRELLYLGQTPDSFKIQVLRGALSRLTGEERNAVTGTAQICMMKGIPIHTVPGSCENIKITTDSDYRLAQILFEMIGREEKAHEYIGVDGKREA